MIVAATVLAFVVPDDGTRPRWQMAVMAFVIGAGLIFVTPRREDLQ